MLYIHSSKHWSRKTKTNKKRKKENLTMAFRATMLSFPAKVSEVFKLFLKIGSHSHK